MTSSKPDIHLVAICGSVRPGNYTSKALALAADEARAQDDVRVTVIDPAEWSLQPAGMGGDGEPAARLQEVVGEATGVLLATPEYHGSFSGVTKMVLENLGFPSVLASKPISLLGVAGGAIGAIKSLEHLRSVCSHIGAIVLPGPVSVANVQKVFDEQGKCLDPGTEKRVRGSATKLVDYVRGHICPRLCLEQMAREAAES